MENDSSSQPCRGPAARRGLIPALSIPTHPIPTHPIPTSRAWLSLGSWDCLMPGGHWYRRIPLPFARRPTMIYEKINERRCRAWKPRFWCKWVIKVWGWEWGVQQSSGLLLLRAWPLPAVPLAQFVIICEKIWAPQYNFTPVWSWHFIHWFRYISRLSFTRKELGRWNL